MLSSLKYFILQLIGQAPERPSPPNMIPWSNIELIDNGDGTGELVIKGIPLPALVQSCDFNTNSMDGAFDVGHASLYILNKEFIKTWAHPGAIISFSVIEKGLSVGRLHQIVEENFDEQGWYCITQGLNCGYPDPWKVRLENITGIVYNWLWAENMPGKNIYLGGV